MFRTGVDAVVVNYRTPEDLEGFLAAWKAFRPTMAGLTVVNVDATDQDKEIAAASSDIALQMDYDSNVGYARACNDAAAVGNSEVIALFNADTRITAGSVDLCYEALMSNEEWGVLGPRQVDDHNRLTHAGIFGTNTHPVIRAWMQPDTGLFSEIRSDAVTVMGSIYFIKRHVWNALWMCPQYQRAVPEATGAFLPTPHYYEETWASYHARAHDWKCVYFGLTKMIHRWHKASPVGGFADRYFKTSQEEFRRVCDAHRIPRD